MTPELRDLYARVQRLENELQRRQVIPATSPGAVYRQLLVGSGNTLATLDSVTYKGVKRAGSVVNVPTLIPASISTATGDGLTAAYDLGTDPSATSGPLAWLASCAYLTIKNPAGSGPDTPVGFLTSPQMREGTLVACISSYLVPVSGSPGTYARVYVPAVVSV